METTKIHSNKQDDVGIQPSMPNVSNNFNNIDPAQSMQVDKNNKTKPLHVTNIHQVHGGIDALMKSPVHEYVENNIVIPTKSHQETDKVCTTDECWKSFLNVLLNDENAEEVEKLYITLYTIAEFQRKSKLDMPIDDILRTIILTLQENIGVIFKAIDKEIENIYFNIGYYDPTSKIEYIKKFLDIITLRINELKNHKVNEKHHKHLNVIETTTQSADDSKFSLNNKTEKPVDSSNHNTTFVGDKLEQENKQYLENLQNEDTLGFTNNNDTEVVTQHYNHDNQSLVKNVNDKNDTQVSAAEKNILKKLLIQDNLILSKNNNTSLRDTEIILADHDNLDNFLARNDTDENEVQQSTAEKFNLRKPLLQGNLVLKKKNDGTPRDTEVVQIPDNKNLDNTLIRIINVENELQFSTTVKTDLRKSSLQDYVLFTNNNEAPLRDRAVLSPDNDTLDHTLITYAKNKNELQLSTTKKTNLRQSSLQDNLILTNSNGAMLHNTEVLSSVRDKLDHAVVRNVKSENKVHLATTEKMNLRKTSLQDQSVLTNKSDAVLRNTEFLSPNNKNLDYILKKIDKNKNEIKLSMTEKMNLNPFLVLK